MLYIKTWQPYVMNQHISNITMTYLPGCKSYGASLPSARQVYILCDHEVFCESAQASRINSLIAGLTANNCKVFLITPKLNANNLYTKKLSLLVIFIEF